jgi:hypothetical protein
MTPEQFCYWMQGFTELSGGLPPTAEQWKSIGEHLQTVFKKETPPVGSPLSYPPGVRSPMDRIMKESGWPIDFKPNDIVC